MTYRLKISPAIVLISLLMIFGSGLAMGLVIRTIEGTEELKRNRLSLEDTLERMDPK